MVLTDELSASAAEAFAAVMQDEKRALLYGMRTDGAGGAVNQFPAGVYMESYVSLAWSILIRKTAVDSGTEFPAMPYIENIGVRPDRVDDYMTAANLLDNGRAFVNRIVTVMEEYVRSKRPAPALR
jgi:C-terminal processing protease CtpA/Prc